MGTELNLGGWLGLASSVRLPMDTQCPLFQDPLDSIKARPPRSEKDNEERRKAAGLLRQVWPRQDIVPLSKGIEWLDAEEKTNENRLGNKRVLKVAHNKYLTVADILTNWRAEGHSQGDVSSQDDMSSQWAWSPGGSFERPGWAFSLEILFWLAYRRQRMFRTATAERTYDVGLPPVIVQADRDANQSYLVAPVATLYRKHTRYFRRLLTVNLFFIPIPKESVASIACQAGGPSREVERFPLCLNEIGAVLNGDQTFSAVSADRAAGAEEGWKKFSAFQIAEHYLKLVIGVMLKINRDSLPGEIEFEIKQACDPMTNGSTLKMAVLETPLTLAQVRQWNLGTPDRDVEAIAIQLMKRRDDDVDKSDMRDCALSNSMLGNRDYVGVFDVGNSFFFALLPKDNMAEFGDAASWSMTHIRGLSTLREMIWLFYQEVAISPERTQLATVTMEFVEDFEQFYGLDWRAREYEREFQRLKRLDGTEEKFKSLREKLTSLGEHLNTEANFALQYVVMVATALGLVIGMYSGFPMLSLGDRSALSAAVLVVLFLLFRLIAPATLSAGWKSLRDRVRHLNEGEDP